LHSGHVAVEGFGLVDFGVIEGAGEGGLISTGLFGLVTYPIPARIRPRKADNIIISRLVI